jgi:hypothetical protein
MTSCKGKVEIIMAKTQICYFSLTSSLQGCYMPDAHWGAYAVSRRKDLIGAVRDTLNMILDQEGDRAVSSAMRDVNWRSLWSQAKRHGTSSIHFCIETGEHTMLEFHGMTEAEYLEAEREND